MNETTKLSYLVLVFLLHLLHLALLAALVLIGAPTTLVLPRILGLLLLLNLPPLALLLGLLLLRAGLLRLRLSPRVRAERDRYLISNKDFIKDAKVRDQDRCQFLVLFWVQRDIFQISFVSFDNDTPALYLAKILCMVL